MQRFKIGLNWENNIDKRLEEHQLDLNQGTPDRGGKSPNPGLRYQRMRSQVLGVRVFEICFGVNKPKTSQGVSGPRLS